MPARDLPAQLPSQSNPAHEHRQISRALTIMELLADAGDGLGISEVARRAALPKTTAARILTDLVGVGVLERRQDHYRPGRRMLALAGRTEPAGAVPRRRRIQYQLERLRDETGLSVAFSTLRYGRVRVEAVLYVPTQVEALSSVSHWAPAHCTCSGKVLLAFSPRAENQLLDDHAHASYTSRTITDPAALVAELARIRKEGMARNEGEYLRGLSALAAPVLTPRLGLAGALAVCGGYHEVETSSVRAALRHAAVASIPRAG